MSIAGPIDWAGVGDTYFAMVAVPSKRLEGWSFTPRNMTSQPMVKPEKRLPDDGLGAVPTDGSHTIVYTGPKDHYLLTQAGTNLSQVVGRNIDLEGLIDLWLV